MVIRYLREVREAFRNYLSGPSRAASFCGEVKGGRRFGVRERATAGEGRGESQRVLRQRLLAYHQPGRRGASRMQREGRVLSRPGRLGFCVT